MSSAGTRRTVPGTPVILAVLLTFPSLYAIDASNRYRSPRNPERAIRRSTELIVLHTTEAPARSSLNKLSDRGEAHFCVTEEGSVYRIVDRDREAFHAGRSMWNGREDVDKFSIGIECVGYHDKPMGMVQLRAVARLVRELQSMYRIPDHCVVAHSHVAYGAPNKWQKCRHRGRKRCGMLFATATVRRLLGLRTKPGSDADVRSRRLTVGDPYLDRVLYGGLDVMASHYPKAPCAPTPRAIRVPANRRKGDPAVKRPSGIAKGVTLPPQTVADLKARGYRLHGVLGAGKTALKLVGAKWNAADTYYVVRGKLTAGNKVDPAHLEKGTEIWMR